MLYDYPEYYETAFSFRDIEKESDFIDLCIKKYSKIDVLNIFEIACGNAPHAGNLTKLGYRYHGLDLNRNMIDFATYKWRNLDPPIDIIEADMIKFDHEMKQDFAFVMLGSLYLNSFDEIKSHFDSMSNLLNTGGLYFLDWCIQFGDPLEHNNNNRFVIEKNGIEIDSHFNVKLIDKDHQMYEEIWTVNVNDHGRHKQFSMIERNKAILPEEFLKLIADRNDFEFIGWWREWDFDKPIENKHPVTRPVAIIRKV